jgi:hypothetical protein
MFDDCDQRQEETTAGPLENRQSDRLSTMLGRHTAKRALV